MDDFERLTSSSFSSSSSLPKQQQVLVNELSHAHLENGMFPFSRNLNVEGSKRVCLAPSHAQMPPISPYTRFRLNDVSMDSHALLLPPRLPPRKAHRRSNSDIPFGYSSFPFRTPEEKAEGEGEVVDDLFSAYMNLDSIETMNSSGTKTTGGDSSDNEATSSVNQPATLIEKKEGVKRSAAEDIAPTTRHCRSLSMDSFMEKLSFRDESPKLLPSPTNSIDSNSNTFNVEFGNGEFSGAELKKIMENDKLAEIALADPKRVKRILANRQSAARSKERKTRYIAELEHKVQTLQTEATTLSAQLTLLQRDSAGLTGQNSELKFRLQAMEQQAQLRDALSEALTDEVQRLKIAATELCGDTAKFQQLSINSQMFQLQEQQAAHLHQRQQQHQQHNQAHPQTQQKDNSTFKIDVSQ